MILASNSASFSTPGVKVFKKNEDINFEKFNFISYIINQISLEYFVPHQALHYLEI